MLAELFFTERLGIPSERSHVIDSSRRHRQERGYMWSWEKQDARCTHRVPIHLAVQNLRCRCQCHSKEANEGKTDREEDRLRNGRGTRIVGVSRNIRHVDRKCISTRSCRRDSIAKGVANRHAILDFGRYGKEWAEAISRG